MTKLAATTIAIAILALFGAIRAQCLTDPAQAAAHAAAPVSSPASPASPIVNEDDDAACRDATLSEDAASCDADGSEALGECCLAGTERWIRPNGSHKCCGPCFM